ncbi:hypothetical protein BKA67DRAFT_530991 [Truncatella angustata]|uniref:Uncharacterized protein n=1 Tax=Truncatella angustata TaxID=152316 RepID=A0A9P8UYU9_9PEZI|nr:uncharacterized protein BKA67DRAFT_530991 [Truncatella angustata]KAH6660910.1 hypothetical protein BKA67DRAFT_530991 [Truncatella angustata]
MTSTGMLLVDTSPQPYTLSRATWQSQNLPVKPFSTRVDTWAEDGSEDDICEEIEDNVIDIPSRYNKGNFKKFRQSLSCLMVEQVLAAEMIIAQISDHRGQLATFKHCLITVCKDHVKSSDTDGHWPVRLMELRPIVLAVINFLLERCWRRQGKAPGETVNEVGFLDMHTKLESALLIDVFPDVTKLPTLVARLQECFKRLHKHRLDSLWDLVYVKRQNEGYHDCVCSSTSAMSIAGAFTCMSRFRKFTLTTRQRACQGVSVRPMPGQRPVPHGVAIRLGNLRPSTRTRALPLSYLEQCVETLDKD